MGPGCVEGLIRSLSVGGLGTRAARAVQRFTSPAVLMNCDVRCCDRSLSRVRPSRFPPLGS